MIRTRPSHVLLTISATWLLVACKQDVFPNHARYLCGDIETRIVRCDLVDERLVQVVENAKGDFARKIAVPTGDATFDACMRNPSAYIGMVGFDGRGMFVEVHSTDKCAQADEAMSSVRALYRFELHDLQLTDFERI